MGREYVGIDFHRRRSVVVSDEARDGRRRALVGVTARRTGVMSERARRVWTDGCKDQLKGEGPDLLHVRALLLEGADGNEARHADALPNDGETLRVNRTRRDGDGDRQREGDACNQPVGEVGLDGRRRRWC